MSKHRASSRPLRRAHRERTTSPAHRAVATHARKRARHVGVVSLSVAAVVTLASGAAVIAQSRDQVSVTTASSSIHTTADAPLAAPPVPDAPESPATSMEVVHAALNDPVRGLTPRLKDAPAVAVAAYQRAASIMEASAEGCGLDWFELAAVAAVQSNHGTVSGGAYTDDGTLTEPLRGARLDGKGRRAMVGDTDHGQVDSDKNFDRGVGPLMLMPSVWSKVAVDADGDGRRDPQNIHDASLAAAVFLCSTDGQMGSAQAARKTLALYNPAQRFARRVLDVAAKFRIEFKRVKAVTPHADPIPVMPTIPAPPTTPESTDPSHNPAPSPTSTGAPSTKPPKPSPPSTPTASPSTTLPPVPSDEPSVTPDETVDDEP